MDQRIIDRVKMANTQMKQQLAAAQKVVQTITAEKALGDAKITSMQDQIESSKKTIRDLERKVQELTKSLEESFSKLNRKEKYTTAKKSDQISTDSGVKISVN